jgi:hypothetical protein
MYCCDFAEEVEMVVKLEAKLVVVMVPSKWAIISLHQSSARDLP